MPRLISASARRSSPSLRGAASAASAGGEQPLHLRDDRRQVAALPGQGEPHDGEQHLQASAALRVYRHRLFVPFQSLCRQREVALRLLQRSAAQLVQGRQRGELRIGRHHAGRECGEELTCGGGLPVEREVDPMIGQQASGQAPVSRRLSMPDRLHRVPVFGIPPGRRRVQRGKLTWRGPPQL